MLTTTGHYNGARYNAYYAAASLFDINLCYSYIHSPCCKEENTIFEEVLASYYNARAAATLLPRKMQNSLLRTDKFRRRRELGHAYFSILHFNQFPLIRQISSIDEPAYIFIEN